VFDRALKRNIVFSPHNLAQDSPFNEFNVILCRNVLIYFNKRLQERVQSLLYQSLILFGILGLGQQETIKFDPCEDQYEEVESGTRLYRRIG
jgi:chemotaxis protein methyltransferase CheR